jgi:hypothetical protein
MACKTINAGITAYLERQGMTHVGQLTGSLRLHERTPILCGC